jgi:hypothetical protein
MTIRSYKPKGSTVKAEKFDADNENVEELASWCNGRVVHDTLDGNTRIKVPTLDGVLELLHGDYLCHTKADGFYIMKMTDFENMYELIKTTRQQ